MSESAGAPTVEPPRAEKRPHVVEVHGRRLEDPYAWLKAENWREALRDPKTLPTDIRAYLEAENAYAATLLGPLEDLKKRLVAEMRGRIKEDDSSVPVRDGPFDYAVRHREGGQHPLVVRRPADAPGADEQILLDGDALAEGRAFFQLGSWSPSPDHRLLAWSADEAGSEFLAIRIRDLSTGEDLPDVTPDATGAVVWTADGRAYWYVRLDAEHRALEVWRHALGRPAETDVLVFKEADPGWFVGIEETRSGAYCVVTVSDHDTSEARLIARAAPDAAPRLIYPRQAGVRYEIDHHPDYEGRSTLFIRTSAGDAVDFKLVAADADDPSNVREIIPHRAGVYLLDHAVTARHLTRLERVEALPRIVIRDLASGAEHEIAFPEAAYSLGVSSGPTFDTDLTRFVYSSPATPSETWDYDMGTRERTLRKRQEIPSGHDPSDYVVRRILAPAPDGETVPVTIIHRADLAPDGAAPCLLYGYGAYGIAIPASFSGGRLSLVDRGFVYAIAHIRGGTEKGWGWYLDGKLANKTNTFTDFIAAAEALCAEGFASPGAIVAHGGSAGGMLMGAVANMRPDLFAAILAEVPFVDVLATMMDETLPLTPPEWPEWGDPIRDAAAFERIRGYSPVDNVAPRPYPAILALAGLTDPRVTYWEPAKWVARLRDATTSDQPIALRTNMDAGHGGASGRFDRLEEVALAYAFALSATGRASG
ncbi:S9 family peptidase [Chenggangzhangella methanolivorans]|uniref:S9 family peptidase n=1 Tax=Chenggangzhangella methanolivorans TaxID=1437009 RepID=A0A9E6RBI6_9HYPH|nr:S9 family peptidase [Chenggangzhangella methanolivorans]QZO00825.1 S9 family peptidase [Chenggangzhangella methanolivorans]